MVSILKELEFSYNPKHFWTYIFCTEVHYENYDIYSANQSHIFRKIKLTDKMFWIF